MFELISSQPVKKIIAVLLCVVWGVAARAADADSVPAPNVVNVTNFVTITNFVTLTNWVAGPGSAVVTNAAAATNQVAAAKKVIVIKADAPVKIKKPVWQNSISAGLTITRGNSETLLATAKFQSQKKTPQNEWIYEADAAYGQNNSVLSQDILHGNAQYNHLFNQRLYGYASADAQHDGIQDLAYQVSLSPGAGYYFIKTLATQVVGEIGPGIITERRGQDNETYMTLRLAEHWDQKIGASAKCWEKVELLPEVTKFDNYIMNAEVGLESPLYKNLSLQVTLDDAYVNEPAADRTSNDVRLVSGIVYKF